MDGPPAAESQSPTLAGPRGSLSQREARLPPPITTVIIVVIIIPIIIIIITITKNIKIIITQCRNGPAATHSGRVKSGPVTATKREPQPVLQPAARPGAFSLEGSVRGTIWLLKQGHALLTPMRQLRPCPDCRPLVGGVARFT